MTTVDLQAVMTFSGFAASHEVAVRRFCDPLAGCVMSPRDHVGVVVKLEENLNALVVATDTAGQ